MANYCENKAQSGIPKKYFCIQWVVEDFGDIAQRPTLINDKSTCVQGEQNWTVRLQAEEDNWIGISCSTIRSTMKPHPKTFASLEIIIPMSDSSGSLFFRRETEIARLGMLITMKKVINLNQPIENLPLVNGSLIIIVSVMEYARMPSSPMLHIPFPNACHLQLPNTVNMRTYERHSISSFMKDMEHLLESGGESSDFKIVTENKEFLVHKQILSARSLVFTAMFQSQFKERQDGVVEVPDVPSKIMDIVLQYIYTGNLKGTTELTAEELIELAYAAEKYGLKELLELCDDVLDSKINKDNALQFYTMAKNLNLKFSRITIVQYMKDRLNEVYEEEDVVFLLGKLQEKNATTEDKK